MIQNKKEKVVVFGHSDNPQRYSYQASELLKKYHHDVVAFNPRIDDSKNLPVNFDTLTLYVSEAVTKKFEDLLLGLHFKRVIFNPGTENPELEAKLKARQVEIIHGCTLVMLKTNQF